MSIDLKTVNRIASLANIHIAEEDKAALQEELGKILDYVAQLSKVETDDVAPMVSPFEEEAVWREDKMVHTNQAAQILQNAPDAKMGFFVVPKVVDNE